MASALTCSGSAAFLDPRNLPGQLRIQPTARCNTILTTQAPSIRVTIIDHGLSKSCRVQVRRRWCRLLQRNQCRPTRTPAQTRSRNHRSRQGPILLQEPRRQLRVSPLSHCASKRWLVPRPHPGSQAPDQPRPPCCERGQRTSQP